MEQQVFAEVWIYSWIQKHLLSPEALEGSRKNRLDVWVEV